MLSPGPFPQGLAMVMLVLAIIALIAAIGVVVHLRDKNLKNPPKKDGLTISFSRGLGLKFYFSGLMTAMVMSAMVAVWKPWLWGGVVVLLIGAGRLNAALHRADSSADHSHIIEKTALFIALWAVATWLGLMV